MNSKRLLIEIANSDPEDFRAIHEEEEEDRKITDEAALMIFGN